MPHSPVPIPHTGYPQYPPAPQMQQHEASSKKWVWWVIALLALGVGVGATLAIVFS